MDEWIVRANPARYDLKRRLANPAWIITWGVPQPVRTQVRRGHRVLLATSGKAGAIYARGVILSDVVMADEAQSELQFAHTPDQFNQPKERVFIEIIDRFQAPVALADIQRIPGLAGMAIFTGFQQTSFFRVTDVEANLLDSYLAERHPGDCRSTER